MPLPRVDRHRRAWRVTLVVALVLGSGASAARTGALERIAAGKGVSIAYAGNAYPLSFKDAEGTPRGFAVDLCRRIVDGLARDLSAEALEIAWVEGNTPRRLAAVINGEADLECGPTAVTLALQAQVDFSSMVFVESAALLVRRQDRILGLADLAGRRVGVMPETTTERRLRPALEAAHIDAQLVPIIDAKDGLERLTAKALDAVAGDRLVLLGQIAASGAAEQFMLVDAEFSVEPYAFALPRNDADLRLAVNRVLAEVYRSGEVDQLFKRWFGADAQPTTLLDTIWFIYGFAD